MRDRDTEELLEKSQAGDQSAAGVLLEMHRERLRRMVQYRMQASVAARVDASDIVQETFAEASRKLPEYLRDRPVPFYCWLRRIAWERLVRLHEFHVQTAKRSAAREADGWLKLTDHSSLMLVNRLAEAQLTPSQNMMKAELLRRTRQVLEQLPPRDQEVLTMRYLEQMSPAEIAATLGINVPAVNMRHMRALARVLRDNGSRDAGSGMNRGVIANSER